MIRRLLTFLLPLLLAGCQDAPLQPEEPSTGPVNVSVAAASTQFLRCGQEIPVIVTVTGSNGRPVSGFHLNFNVLEGGGRMFGGAALTNNRGVARDLWTLGGVANLSNKLAVRAVDPATGVGKTYFEQAVITHSQIAFHRPIGHPSIYVVDPDGTGLRRLTDDGGADQDPAWSPDGRRIALSSSRGGGSNIHVMNADGTGLQQLTFGAFSESRPAWSPDGRQLAFASNRSGSTPSIHVINADGTDLRLLTDDAGQDDYPAWSPDGRQIAFQSTRGSGKPVPFIYVMNTDGTDLRRLTDDWAGGPAWSPDGRQIAFHSDRGGSTSSITVMNTDGTGIRRLTDDAGQDHDPVWSPDGRQIAFMSKRGGIASSIYVVNADGTNLQRLTDGGADEWTRDVWAVGDWAPAWSGCRP